MFNKAKAKELARNVIVKYIEGGYYHPDGYYNGMRTCNGGKIQAKAFQPVYRWSGETMMGQDRTAGHDLYYSTPQPASVFTVGTDGKKRPDPFKDIPFITANKYAYKSEDAREFWQTIDNASARTKWCFNYLGGELNGKLMELAGGIMYDEFMRYYYPKLPKEIQDGIHTDDALASNVFYTTWNGAGFLNSYLKRYKQYKETNPPKTTADTNRLYLLARDKKTRAKMQTAVKTGLGVDINTYNSTNANKTTPEAPKKKFNFVIVGGLSVLFLFWYLRKKR